MGSIGYFEAWQLWFSGQEIDPQQRLGPMTVLWWGRAGKVAAFVGGLTVILDLVGPDRLRQWGRAVRTTVDGEQPLGCALAFCLLILGGLAWTVVSGGDPVTPIVIIGLVVVYVAVAWGVNWLAWGLDHRVPGWGIRLSAAMLIAVGFHFDLLAS